ncbi:hypothetical protein [Aeoliella sp.]|uniref:hypothetical protein n=1 Tax=Aeoliella sp. TaxID=2795800 RepID=UPI003CCBE35E
MYPIWQLSCTTTRVWQILRRRWWMLALLVLLLLVLAPVLWQMVRPHSDLEQQLVGTWKWKSYTDEVVTITLHPNRTITWDGEFLGTWSASGDTFEMCDLNNVDEVLRVLFADGTVTSRVVDVSDSSLTFTHVANGQTLEWQRVDTD